jgi:hypothetical protein
MKARWLLKESASPAKYWVIWGCCGLRIRLFFAKNPFMGMPFANHKFMS